MRRAVSVARFLKMSWRVSGRPSPGGGGGGGATGGATIGTSGTSVIRAGSDI